MNVRGLCDWIFALFQFWIQKLILKFDSLWVWIVILLYNSKTYTSGFSSKRGNLIKSRNFKNSFSFGKKEIFMELQFLDTNSVLKRFWRRNERKKLFPNQKVFRRVFLKRQTHLGKFIKFFNVHKIIELSSTIYFGYLKWSF